MKALDTNVLARFFIDDPDDRQAVRQRPAAIAALSGTGVRVRHGVARVRVGDARLLRHGAQGHRPRLRALVGIEQVTIEDQTTVLTALEAFDAGLDLADALHVCRSGRATGFATFDRRLVRRAARVALPQEVELLT